jgi:hypothetical protein
MRASSLMLLMILSVGLGSTVLALAWRARPTPARERRAPRPPAARRART